LVLSEPLPSLDQRSAGAVIERDVARVPVLTQIVRQDVVHGVTQRDLEEWRCRPGPRQPRRDPTGTDRGRHSPQLPQPARMWRADRSRSRVPERPARPTTRSWPDGSRSAASTILLTLVSQSAVDVLDEVVQLFDQAVSARGRAHAATLRPPRPRPREDPSSSTAGSNLTSAAGRGCSTSQRWRSGPSVSRSARRRSARGVLANVTSEHQPTPADMREASVIRSDRRVGTGTSPASGSMAGMSLDVVARSPGEQGACR
jgi:hypothetical protein